MKLTLANKVRKAKGLTLIEMTVVILVLLSLIAILFVGARAWKRGSDRAANIMNVRNVQMATRSYQNMNNLIAGDVMSKDDIIGTGKFIEVEPTPPSASTAVQYEYLTGVPAVGQLFITNYDLGGADGEWFFKTGQVDTSGW